MMKDYMEFEDVVDLIRTSFDENSPFALDPSLDEEEEFNEMVQSNQNNEWHGTQEVDDLCALLEYYADPYNDLRDICPFLRVHSDAPEEYFMMWLRDCYGKETHDLIEDCWNAVTALTERHFNDVNSWRKWEIDGDNFYYRYG